MIARIWHGVTKANKADEYLDYLNETGIPDYRNTNGNRGAYVLGESKMRRRIFTLCRSGIRSKQSKSLRAKITKKPDITRKTKNFCLNLKRPFGI